MTVFIRSHSELSSLNLIADALFRDSLQKDLIFNIIFPNPFEIGGCHKLLNPNDYRKRVWNSL